jgi:hypothetical protein
MTRKASWHVDCVPEAAMDEQKLPKDSDPSDMTDFEDNATQHELGEILPSPNITRDRREQINHEPDDNRDIVPDA